MADGTWSDSLLYNDTYVAHSGHYHPEVSGARNGEAGIPVNTSMHTDSIILTALFFCVLVTIATVRKSWRYTRYMLFNIWHTVRGDAYDLRESIKQERHHWPLLIITLIMVATVTYIGLHTYMHWDAGTLYDYDEQCITIGEAKIFMPNVMRYTAILLLLALWRGFLYLLQHAVNRFIFSRDNRRIWNITMRFLFAMQGILILPIVIVHYLFGASTLVSVAYTVFILILTRFNRFIRTYSIFFGKKRQIFRYFLYLCAFEILPLAILAGLMTIISPISHNIITLAVTQ